MAWVGGVYTRENPTYSGSDVWQQDAANGFEVISSSRHDVHDQDLAEGINNCLAKDGSNAMTGDFNLGGNSIINGGPAVVAGDYAILGQTITNISFSTGTITFTRDSAANLTLTLGSMGLVVDTDVQAYSADLTAIAALAKTDGNFIVGNGTTWVAESGSTVRTSLGLGSLATANSVNNSNWSGTDLAVTNGGTGASDAAGARANLGLGSLSTVNSISNDNWSGTDLAVTNGGTGSSTAAGARTNLGLSGATTVSSSAPSGGSDGDVWFQV